MFKTIMLDVRERIYMAYRIFILQVDGSGAKSYVMCGIR